MVCAHGSCGPALSLSCISVCVLCAHRSHVLPCPSPPCPLSQGLAEPVSQQAPASSVFTPTVLGLQAHSQFFTWVPGSEFKSACLHRKLCAPALSQPTKYAFSSCGRCRSRVEHYYTVMGEFWGSFLTRDLDHDITGFRHAPPHPTRLTLRVQALLSPFPRQDLGTQRPARVAVRFGGLQPPRAQLPPMQQV